MQKFIATALLCFIVVSSFSQSKHIISPYLQIQYTTTIHDRTAGNNPWGVGLGLGVFINTGSRFKPIVDLTGDVYLQDDKILRINEDESHIARVDGMINIFAGGSYHPSKTVYLSLVAGPSFVSGRTLLGLKPSFGFYFSEKQRWTGKMSYINVFNRDKTSKMDFGSVSLSIGLRLF